jgi:hypothetical protein
MKNEARRCKGCCQDEGRCKDQDRYDPQEYVPQAPKLNAHVYIVNALPVQIPETEIDFKFLEDVDYETEELFKAVEDILAQQGVSAVCTNSVLWHGSIGAS